MDGPNVALSRSRKRELECKKRVETTMQEKMTRRTVVASSKGMMIDLGALWFAVGQDYHAGSSHIIYSKYKSQLVILQELHVARKREVMSAWSRNTTPSGSDCYRLYSSRDTAPSESLLTFWSPSFEIGDIYSTVNQRQLVVPVSPRTKSSLQ